ncbi:hypothetical protein [Desulfobulbus sp.]|uniref:hypothetical protein n=1 Tax=Desulfobulbus sp. TaxID=895 RepID=UPI00286EBCEF|nr:hypothetical protein [Desulfobulbus sp.]
MDPEELGEFLYGDGEFNIPYEIDLKWFSNEPIEGVNFAMNNLVVIISGSHMDKK